MKLLMMMVVLCSIISRPSIHLYQLCALHTETASIAPSPTATGMVGCVRTQKIIGALFPLQISLRGASSVVIPKDTAKWSIPKTHLPIGLILEMMLPMLGTFVCKTSLESVTTIGN